MTFFSYLLEGEDSVSFKIDGGGSIYPKWILDRNITPTLKGHYRSFRNFTVDSAEAADT